MGTDTKKYARWLVVVAVVAAAAVAAGVAATSLSSLSDIARHLEEQNREIEAVRVERIEANKEMAEYQRWVDTLAREEKAANMGKIMLRTKAHNKRLEILDGRETRAKAWLRKYDRDRTDVLAYLRKWMIPLGSVIVVLGTALVFLRR